MSLVFGRRHYFYRPESVCLCNGRTGSRLHKKRWGFARRMDARIDPMALMPDSVGSDILHGHVVLVGYGEKGKIILEELLQRHLSVVVVDDHHSVIEELRERNVNSIYGDATDPCCPYPSSYT